MKRSDVAKVIYNDFLPVLQFHEVCQRRIFIFYVLGISLNSVPLLNRGVQQFQQQKALLAILTLQKRKICKAIAAEQNTSQQMKLKYANE